MSDDALISWWELKERECIYPFDKILNLPEFLIEELKIEEYKEEHQN